MKKTLLFLLTLFPGTLFADTLTSGVSLIKPTTGQVDTRRSWADKFNFNFDVIGSSLNTANTRLNSLDTSTSSADSRLDGLELFQTTATTMLNNLNTSTGILTNRIDGHDLFRTTATSSINNLNTSTGIADNRLDGLELFQATGTTRLDNLTGSTNSLRSNLSVIVATNITPGVIQPGTLEFTIGTSSWRGANIFGSNQNAFDFAIASANGKRFVAYVQASTYTFTANSAWPYTSHFIFEDGAVITQTGGINPISSSGTISGYLTLTPASSWAANYYLRLAGSGADGVKLKNGSIGSIGRADQGNPKDALIVMTGTGTQLTNFSMTDNAWGGAALANTWLILDNCSHCMVDRIYIKEPTNNGISLNLYMSSWSTISNLEAIVDSLTGFVGYHQHGVTRRSEWNTFMNWNVHSRLGPSNNEALYDIGNLSWHRNINLNFYASGGSGAGAGGLYNVSEISTGTMVVGGTFQGAGLPQTIRLGTSDHNFFMQGTKFFDIGTVFSDSGNNSLFENYFSNGAWGSDH